MRLGVLVSHPIQYLSPWFRLLSESLELQVLYAHRQDGRGQAEAGFGVPFEWDTPLLEGYSHRFLTNRARRPGVGTFGGCDTPEIFAVLRSRPFDALLVFGWNHKSLLQGVLAAKRWGVPVLLRGDSQLLTRRSVLLRLAKYVLYRALLPRVEAHFYAGRRNKEYLTHYGVPESRLFHLPHFVDTDFFATRINEARMAGERQRKRTEFEIPEGAFVFAFVGKMIPKKRPLDVLQAIAVITRMSSDSSIAGLFVGDGELRASLEGAARASGARIRFAGFANQTLLPALYGASDAVVLASDAFETWGLVVNEAAACGLPYLVSDACGCAPDMVDEGMTGYSFPVGNIHVLARRMLELRARVSQSPGEVRGALQQKTRAHSMRVAADRLLEALRVVIERSSPRPAG